MNRRSDRPSRRPRPLLDAMLSKASDWRTPAELAVLVGREPRDGSVPEMLRQYHRRGWFERRPSLTDGARWQYRAAPHAQEARAA